MRLFYYLCLIGMLSSCMNYQYVTVSNTQLKPGARNEFIHETDSVSVTYSFDGINGPVKVKVFNKTDKPLYVDWSKSAIIIDSERQSYYQETARINAMSSTTEARGAMHVSNGLGQTSGSLIFNERISFIPPLSFANYQSLTLKSDFFFMGDPLTQKRTKIATTSGKEGASTLAYEAPGTPLRFRSFLTLSFRENFENTFSMDHTFWVSEVMQISASPKSMVTKPANRFYIQRVSDTGIFLRIICGVAIISGAVFLLKDW